VHGIILLELRTQAIATPPRGARDRGSIIAKARGTVIRSGVGAAVGSGCRLWLSALAVGSGCRRAPAGKAFVPLFIVSAYFREISREADPLARPVNYNLAARDLRKRTLECAHSDPAFSLPSVAPRRGLNRRYVSLLRAQ
jgi:hypothetical protein